jgi:hypothetical protein
MQSSDPVANIASSYDTSLLVSRPSVYYSSMSLGSRQSRTVVTPPENQAGQTVTLGLISVAALLVSLTQSLLVPCRKAPSSSMT